MIEKLLVVLGKFDEGIGEKDWGEIKSAFNDLEVIVVAIQHQMHQTALRPEGWLFAFGFIAGAIFTIAIISGRLI